MQQYPCLQSTHPLCSPLSPDPEPVAAPGLCSRLTPSLAGHQNTCINRASSPSVNIYPFLLPLPPDLFIPSPGPNAALLCTVEPSGGPPLGPKGGGQEEQEGDEGRDGRPHAASSSGTGVTPPLFSYQPCGVPALESVRRGGSESPNLFIYQARV